MGIALGIEDVVYLRVFGFEEGWHKLVLILRPCGVVKESTFHIVWNLQSQVVATVEHSLAQTDGVGRDGLRLVGSVSNLIEEVEVAKVLTVGKCRVAKSHTEIIVYIATMRIAILDIHTLQQVVALECIGQYIVELISVGLADVAQEGCQTVVLLQFIIITALDVEVIYIAVLLSDFLKGIVLEGVCIVTAPYSPVGGHLNLLSHKQVLVFCPIRIFEEVLQHILSHDNLQFRGVATGKEILA